MKRRIASGQRGIRGFVACIGAGGEAGLPFASILCDHGRVAGRTGLEAVMRRLKAIAIRSFTIPLAERVRSGDPNLTNIALRNDTLSRIRATALPGPRVLGLPEACGPLLYGGFSGANRISGSAVAETVLSGECVATAVSSPVGRVRSSRMAPIERA
jgi:aldehyde:ferredoxin oxidoreductase